MSCSSIVAKAVKNATTARGNVVVNNEKFDILMEYCEAIDSFADYINGEVVDSVVDLLKGFVIVRIQTDEMIVENEDRIFYDLAERSVAINFSPAPENDSMFIDFIFPSVWGGQ